MLDDLGIAETVHLLSDLDEPIDDRAVLALKVFDLLPLHELRPVSLDETSGEEDRRKPLVVADATVVAGADETALNRLPS